MPNYFSLTLKGETEPMELGKVDKMICEHFGVPVDPVHYYHGWFESIGLMLAIGKTLDDVIADDDYTWRTREIAKYLKDNFTSHTLTTRGWKCESELLSMQSEARNDVERIRSRLRLIKGGKKR